MISIIPLIIIIIIIDQQCHKIVGEYEDDLIDAFLAKTLDVKKEMCEEITGIHTSVWIHLLYVVTLDNIWTFIICVFLNLKKLDS